MLQKPKEKAYIIEKVGTGEKVLFDLASEAARYMGVTAQYMNQCKSSKMVCKGYRVKGWMKRFYMVGTKAGTFELCTAEDGEFRVVGKRERMDYEEARVVKDATELCMNGESL